MNEKEELTLSDYILLAGIVANEKEFLEETLVKDENGKVILDAVTELHNKLKRINSQKMQIPQAIKEYNKQKKSP